MWTEHSRGTPSYRAPELIAEVSTFSNKVDIWGLGCILYELVMKRKAFEDDWAVRDYAVKKLKLLVPLEYFVSEIQMPLTNLIREMLHINPNARPNALELHEAFTNLLNALPISAFEGEITLFSKIFRLVSDDVESHEDQHTVLDILPSNVSKRKAASNGAATSVFSVYYERNPYFTGRDEFLNKLSKRLSERRPRRYNHRIALYGLGGVGKTQIALEYAYRHQSDYRYVFWISAVDQAQLLSGFREIAKDTRCVKYDDKPEEVGKSVLKWLQVTESWLLIIDNLDDITVVNGYLPTTSGVGHTLITTRNKNSNGIPAEGMEVMVMGSDECVQLLLDLIKLENSNQTKVEARKIVEELGYLPLAIEQSAAYIRESQNLEEFLETYKIHRREFFNWRAEGNYPYSYTVATTVSAT